MYENKVSLPKERDLLYSTLPSVKFDTAWPSGLDLKRGKSATCGYGGKERLNP